MNYSGGKEVNIGVIGAGNIVTTMHLPILSQMENTNLQYIFDIDEQKSKSLSNDYGINCVPSTCDVESLPDCDVVLIAIPVGSRLPYIKEYSSRETAIFTEKPFATSINDHEYFLNIANLISCNYMRVNYSSVNQIKNIIASEFFGTLRQIQLTEAKHLSGTDRGKDSYQTNVELGGGILLETGSHIISQLIYILSGRDIEVLNQNIEYIDDLDTHVEAELSAEINDETCKIDLCLSSIGAFDTIAEFKFDEAIVKFDPTEADDNLTIYSDKSMGKEFDFVSDDDWALSRFQAAYLRWAKFISRIGELEPDSSKYTSLQTTKVISDIYDN